ncbi:MAG: hypothetical protein A2293_07960 [Elusimicrobia bacterium RIFOXYB2_FULL_49_7]|nr:MAG: hypothetical protein A2293_07960 [Elusimicrobia bacterium RIFOXYB2_FULL_49_7]
MRASEKEQEYFALKEFERKKALEVEHHKKMKEAEKKKLKELHHMHCPKCGMELIEIDYKHIKIDKCSECGGIWLDEGELEEVVHLKSGLSRFMTLFVDRK